jgi:D-glycero-D-manno-heptose 1,7-bisphosphate phosphatase
MAILPEAPDALAALKGRGFLLIVVTNQPDVSRGTQERAEVEGMHAWLKSILPLDDFFVCYHDDSDGCDCRKPKPGLLLQAAERYAIELGSSFLIGDRWRDVDAGSAAGCRTVWIDYDYAERAPSTEPSARAESLRAAVDWILAAAVDHGKGDVDAEVHS